MNNFHERLIFGGGAAAILLTAVFLADYSWFKPIFVLLTVFCAVMAQREYYAMGRANGMKPLEIGGYICTAGFLVSLFMSTQNPIWSIMPLAVIWIGTVLAFGYYLFWGIKPYVNLAITGFGVFYLALPFACMMLLVYAPWIMSKGVGNLGLLYLVVVTKSSDVGAYVVGKLWGRHLLCPTVSPKKTWEGAFGGLLASLGASCIFLLCTHETCEVAYPFLTLKSAPWLGILMGVFAQFGDLVESLLKRDMGVKDSSNIPGLGGMLDTMDSLLLTAPGLYLYLLCLSKF